MPKDPQDFYDLERKQLVDSIIGEIHDNNFTDEELDNCYLSDEEVAELDYDYEREVEAGRIFPLTEESKLRFTAFVQRYNDWSCYYVACRDRGEKPLYFEEWDNLAEKPQ